MFRLSYLRSTGLLSRLKCCRPSSYDTLQVQSRLARIRYPIPGPISVRSFGKGGAVMPRFFHGSTASHILQPYRKSYGPSTLAIAWVHAKVVSKSP